jgi:hypothetical protein
MNDTPLAIDPKTEKLEKLKTKLEIEDYICYDVEGDICINSILSLELTETAIQKGLNQDFQKASGVDSNMIKALEAISEADPTVLQGLVGDPNMSKIIDNSSLSQEWQEMNSKKESLEKMVEANQSLPAEKREEAKNNLEELKKGLEELKTKELKANPATLKLSESVIKERPDLLIKLLKAMKPKDDIDLIEVDKNQKLVDLKNKIITSFLKSKNKPLELKNKLTRLDFKLLCYGIVAEPENLMASESIDFFTKTLDLKH